MTPKNPNIAPNSSFHHLPNEIVDEVLFYVFQDAAHEELSSTHSTYEEFTPFFDSRTFEDVDEEKVKLTLYKDMLAELAYGFLEISMQLEGNVRYALGKALREFESKMKRRARIVEKILRRAKRKLL